ncbi:MAG: ADP-ribosylglycohydrolase family protein [Planctomyces sp.]|nr:ADP-ribosylglycohydrolase family protein [Planctomyces sp.]
MIDSSPESRREFLGHSVSLGVVAFTGLRAMVGRAQHETVNDIAKEDAGIQQQAQVGGGNRIRGLLIGGVLGDALGGPVEFQSGPEVDAALPCTRNWNEDRSLNAADLTRLAETLPLYSYEKLRPGIEPYGQWYEDSPAGTTTDDTRHKIVLMRMLKDAVAKQAFPVNSRNLAAQYINFTPKPGQPVPESLAPVVDEAFHEYRLAARWLLGERDPKISRPVERLWAGEPNCSGQMMLTPLAAAFPGDPASAYLAAYSLDFIDGPGARDIAAALVAGLSAVLAPEMDAESVSIRWKRLFDAMESTDPYGYGDVPFAGRPLRRWLDHAREFAATAEGRPSRLFELLETQGRPLYWWDAHFTLLVPVAILIFCEFNPLAALHLTLDFRHDSDSYAHVLAAMAGAVHGEEIFPKEFRETTAGRHREDYGESIDEWEQTLQLCSQRHKSGAPFVLPTGAES